MPGKESLEPNWTSIIPPFLAVILAFITREAVISLTLACIAGALLFALVGRQGDSAEPVTLSAAGVAVLVANFERMTGRAPTEAERSQLIEEQYRTEVLFREALSCYSNNNFNAFASMCRRASVSAFHALGEGGKLRAFEEVMTAQDIAGIDDESFGPVKTVLFGTGSHEELPLLNRAQAGMLVEVLKDMFYQCFVRRGKLTRALKVRQFFVEEGTANLQSAS